MSGQQPSPFAPQAAKTTPTPVTTPGRLPRWFRDLATRLGAPSDIDVVGAANRWLWFDGEAGVVMARHPDVWQVFAFCPDGSVTLRLADRPTDAQIRDAVALSGLSKMARVCRDGGPAGEAA